MDVILEVGIRGLGLEYVLRFVVNVASLDQIVDTASEVGETVAL